jgi:hypothetical protein
MFWNNGVIIYVPSKFLVERVNELELYGVIVNLINTTQEVPDRGKTNCGSFGNIKSELYILSGEGCTIIPLDARSEL